MRKWECLLSEHDVLMEVEKLGVRPEENWLYCIEWEANDKCMYLGRWENAIFSQMYRNTLLIIIILLFFRHNGEHYTIKIQGNNKNEITKRIVDICHK